MNIIVMIDAIGKFKKKTLSNILSVWIEFPFPFVTNKKLINMGISSRYKIKNGIITMRIPIKYFNHFFLKNWQIKIRINGMTSMNFETIARADSNPAKKHLFV